MKNKRVATIAVCPNCRTQLGVPARTAAGAELECPRCKTRFAASREVVQELPFAIVAGTDAGHEHDDHEDGDDAVISGLHFDIPAAPVSGDHRLDVQPAARAPRRRASLLGTAAGIVGGGAAGLLLAGYALLWMTDPPLDLFRMAEWLPDKFLPRAAQAAGDDADADAPQADDADF